MQNNHDAAAPPDQEMKKCVYSDAKDLDGKPLWMIAPDGSILINASAAKDAAISVDVKTLSRQIA